MNEKDFDYKELKFKAGLEIHQQLDTHKLFCKCPSVLRKEDPFFTIERKLHAVVGESGKVDSAVLHEASLNKKFLYQGYNTTCLVEIDEEPPHEINEEALRIALHISLLLNCKIIPITQVMRKTVINGSNTSGFQRTLLIARDGFVETSQGKVRINYIFLEEDSARTIEKRDNSVIYRLDRLGIPLVEISTDADIKSPEQAKEAALKIGDILRSCKVKRGLGTIRQDVNLSIRGENRVELKGVQDMKMFLEIIENEVLRQKKLSDSNKPTKQEVRNALANGKSEFLRPMPGEARMYPETDLPLLHIGKKILDEARRTLPKLRSDSEKDLRDTGLSEEMIKILMKSDKFDFFKELTEILKNPSLIAKIILIYPKEISSKNEDLENEIEEDQFRFIVEAISNNKLKEENVKEAIKRIYFGASLQEAIKFNEIDSSELEETVLNAIKNKPGLSEKAYMGLLMKELSGKISGKELMDLIKKFMN